MSCFACGCRGFTITSLPDEKHSEFESGDQARLYTDESVCASVERSMPERDHILTTPSSPAVAIAVDDHTFAGQILLRKGFQLLGEIDLAYQPVVCARNRRTTKRRWVMMPPHGCTQGERDGSVCMATAPPAPCV